jgi:hypothetical protein
MDFSSSMAAEKFFVQQLFAIIELAKQLSMPGGRFSDISEERKVRTPQGSEPDNNRAF